METAWMYILVGTFLGLIARNLYYTYRKVSKKGEKFKWEYVMTAGSSALFVVWGILQGGEHIDIPAYVAEKGWWALIAMGVMIGVGANDILNIILKTVKKEQKMEKLLDTATKEEDLKEKENL